MVKLAVERIQSRVRAIFVKSRGPTHVLDAMKSYALWNIKEKIASVEAHGMAAVRRVAVGHPAGEIFPRMYGTVVDVVFAPRRKCVVGVDVVAYLHPMHVDISRSARVEDDVVDGVVRGIGFAPTRILSRHLSMEDDSFSIGATHRDIIIDHHTLGGVPIIPPVKVDADCVEVVPNLGHGQYLVGVSSVGVVAVEDLYPAKQRHTITGTRKGEQHILSVGRCGIAALRISEVILRGKVACSGAGVAIRRIAVANKPTLSLHRNGARCVGAENHCIVQSSRAVRDAMSEGHATANGLGVNVSGGNEEGHFDTVGGSGAQVVQRPDDITGCGIDWRRRR